MSGPYQANIINLSSGQILFADPTKPWSPDNFPNLPSTTLSIGVAGRIEDGNIHALTFTNAIAYEPYEPLTERANLKKTLQISATGAITYEEPHLGYVSTLLQSTSVTAFASPAIGAPGIRPYTDSSPDTITNAVAKLDAWIANAFLVQPPAITPVAQESTAFYGGVRWNNFRTFSALDKSFPYVDSIVFVLGDPETGHYCTFELGDSDYFPYKNCVDGICTAKTPVVRLRIYTDTFIPAATSLYTKAAMQTGCVRLISEAGNLTVPSVGKVFALEDTDGHSFYTTVSIYLPNLPNTYPKGTPVPVRIAYMNKTDSAVNIATTSTIQATSGGPSEVSSILYQYATASTLTIQCRRPQYSDATSQITTPFFSTYVASYALQEMRTAHSSGAGFPYGIPNPQTLPAAVQTFANAATTEVIYTASIQNMTLPNLVPGGVWATSVHATNAARHAGVETPAPLLSTLFPQNPASTIAAVAIGSSNVDVRLAGTLYTPEYTAATGWAPASASLDTDVLFLSTAATLNISPVTAVQWNDASYPGDRSTITLRTLRNGTEQAAFAIAAGSNADVLPTGIALSTTTATGACSVVFQDAYAASGPESYQGFYYTAAATGSLQITEISSAIQTAQFVLEGRAIDSSADTIQPTTLSSQVYQFRTDVCAPAHTDTLVYCGISGLQQISGLYTPTPQSEIRVDVYGSNFAHMYIPSTVATVQARLGDGIAGPAASISSFRVFAGTSATEYTALPFPTNSLLRLSSCAVPFQSGIWQDPNDPLDFAIVATLLPANPVSVPAPYMSTITPTIYIDTVSDLQKFAVRTALCGQRVSALLPRSDISVTATNIRDGVSPTGAFDIGLQVPLGGLYTLEPAGLTVAAAALYSHTSSLQQAYTNPYSRELLLMNGMYMHPAGSVFSMFNGTYLGVPSAAYPDFTYDLAADVNHGYRYAMFLYETVLPVPTACQYMYVRIQAPSAVSTIGATRADNNCFPDGPVAGARMAAMKARMHIKLLGIHNPMTYDPFETNWINCWKSQDLLAFDDGVYDTGAAAGATLLPSGDVEYRVQINRRFYARVYTFVRIGLAQDASVYSDAPLQFAGIQVRYSDA